MELIGRLEPEIRSWMRVSSSPGMSSVRVEKGVTAAVGTTGVVAV